MADSVIHDDEMIDETIERQHEPWAKEKIERYERVVRLLRETGSSMPDFIDTCMEAMETPFDGGDGRVVNLDAYCVGCGTDLEHLEKINEVEPGKVRKCPVSGDEDLCSVCWDHRKPIPSDLRKKLESK